MNNLSLQLQLLIILQKYKGKISIADLSTRLKCSINTTIRRIDNINQTLLSDQKIEVYKSKDRGVMVQGNVDEVQRIIDILKENSQYTTWRNREERQLLILLKLISSTVGISKLMVLADSVNVAETTVLKDIKRLNLLFAPIVISSRQGSGTRFEGDNMLIQTKMMDFCYGILTPMNFIAISYNIGRTINEELQVCASELLLSFVNDHVQVKQIIARINIWEESQNMTLSDISFANLLLYIMIFEMRKISSLIIDSCEEKKASSLQAHTLLDYDNTHENNALDNFLLGLDENILFEYIRKNHASNIEHTENIVSKISEVIGAHHAMVSEDTREALVKALTLLEYRHNSSLLYWDDELLSSYQGRLRKNHDFIEKLNALCDELTYDWITTDSLLHILDLHIEEFTLSSIDVTLFCVAGVNTSLMMKKMIERYCPLLKVSKLCSLRNCTEEDLKSNVILSTARSEVLPAHTIIVNSFFKEQEWLKIQEQVLNLAKKKEKS